VVVRLDARGTWDGTGFAAAAVDEAPPPPLAGAQASPTTLSFSDVALPRLNPLLEHVKRAPPPLAASLQRRRNVADEAWLLQVGHAANEAELARQMAAKEVMARAMVLARGTRAIQARRQQRRDSAAPEVRAPADAEDDFRDYDDDDPLYARGPPVTGSRATPSASPPASLRAELADASGVPA
jgi:hypothetical protein